MLPNQMNHSRPDQIIWSNKTKECKLFDCSVSPDQTISMEETEKVNNYKPRVCELQEPNRAYAHVVIPIAIGTLGAIPESPQIHLENMG